MPIPSVKIEDYELVGSYNNQRSPNIDAERSINLFEYIDPMGKKPKSLISTSGLRDTGLVFGDTTGGFRAEFVLFDFEYFVIGTDIWRRDINNVLTKLNGTPLPTSTGYVAVNANNAESGSQILFCDGVIGCAWDTGSNVFTYDLRTVDPGFPPNPIDIFFIDGFLGVASGGTNNFYLSALNNIYSWSGVTIVFTADATTDIITLAGANVFPTGQIIQFNQVGTLPVPLAEETNYFSIFIDSTHIKVASSFADAIAGIPINLTTNGVGLNTVTNNGQLQLGEINSHPGNIVACRTLHRLIFLFSQYYTEVWENAGVGTNLPLRRNNSLLIEYGTPALGTIVTGFDKMMFLSQDRDGLGTVMEVIGSEAIPVSTRALDFQLAQYASQQKISDARGIFIKENGLIFYRLNFTAANHTFVYNVTLSDPTSEQGKLWHEEEILNGDRHPAQTHGFFQGNNFYGDYHFPILYQVAPSFVTNSGEIIPRIRIGRSYVPANYSRIRCDRFMADIVQGLASSTPENIEQPILTENLLDLLTESEVILLTENSHEFLHYDPFNHKIYLSISKDGGVTYGYRQEAFVGGIGKRTFRTVWRKLGVIPRGQGFVPKLEFYGAISLTVLGAAWAYEIMPE